MPWRRRLGFPRCYSIGIEEDNEDFDILDWWKSRLDKFLVLSTMVRDFLALPLSTVSSESAFSLGGRILGERRSSLVPAMLEALVCAKDWLFKDLASEAQDEDLHLDCLFIAGTFVVSILACFCSWRLGDGSRRIFLTKTMVKCLKFL